VQRLTPTQQKVMARLRAGEYICRNWALGAWQLSGGGKITIHTLAALKSAKLIRSLGYRQDWVATEKGDGDDT